MEAHDSQADDEHRATYPIDPTSKQSSSELQKHDTAAAQQKPTPSGPNHRTVPGGNKRQKQSSSPLSSESKPVQPGTPKPSMTAPQRSHTVETVRSSQRKSSLFESAQYCVSIHPPIASDPALQQQNATSAPGKITPTTIVDPVVAVHVPQARGGQPASLLGSVRGFTSVAAQRSISVGSVPSKQYHYGSSSTVPKQQSTWTRSASDGEDILQPSLSGPGSLNPLTARMPDARAGSSIAPHSRTEARDHPNVVEIHNRVQSNQTERREPPELKQSASDSTRHPAMPYTAKKSFQPSAKMGQNMPTSTSSPVRPSLATSGGVQSGVELKQSMPVPTAKPANFPTTKGRDLKASGPAAFPAGGMKGAPPAARLEANMPASTGRHAFSQAASIPYKPVMSRAQRGQIFPPGHGRGLAAQGFVPKMQTAANGNPGFMPTFGAARGFFPTSRGQGLFGGHQGGRGLVRGRGGFPNVPPTHAGAPRGQHAGQHKEHPGGHYRDEHSPGPSNSETITDPGEEPENPTEVEQTDDPRNDSRSVSAELDNTTSDDHPNEFDRENDPLDESETGPETPDDSGTGPDNPDDIESGLDQPDAAGTTPTLGLSGLDESNPEYEPELDVNHDPYLAEDDPN